MAFLLCDLGWCVHKSDVQQNWDVKTHTRRTHFESARLFIGEGFRKPNGGCSEGLDAFRFFFEIQEFKYHERNR